MSSELPPASGRSVFSVFGFGSSHYGDDDFNSPLETAPESFDASNSLTALKKKKKQQGILQEEAVQPFSPETAHKIRVNLPDQSELVLQSFCQSNQKPAAPQQSHPQSHHGLVRRYSTAQEESDDLLSTSGVLTKFNNTLTQTTCLLTRAGGSSANIYSSYKDGTDHPVTSPGTISKAMTRVQSSPHLPVAQHHFGSPKKESVFGSEIISQYLRRNQSQNDLLEVAECQTVNKSDSTSVDSIDTSAVVLSSNLKSEAPKFPDHDSPGGLSPPRPGFSILSKTRQFGAWITKATEGDKVEVTKKDLNVLAPNSF